RQQIPQLANAAATRPAKVPLDDMTSLSSLPPGDFEATEAFEMETLAEALESFAGELTASIEAAEEKAMAGAMEIYYAAEKLAKEPEHAHLIPYVEEMRASYRRDFGVEIPERK
ncbi:MAG TPA: hypothetical protein VHX14_24100, partial [Thermoanaerobaculia bacterium]|nr:hypothetical protein [Thermoanaerobaculia bacterium]